MGATPFARALVVAFAASQVAAGQQFIISTVAGGGRTPVPVPAIQAAIQPQWVAVDSSGNLYFSGYLEIFKLDPAGVLTCVAGTARRGYSGDGGPAIDAQLTPGPIALAPNGDLYFIDTPGSQIRKVSAAGIISTVSGRGYSGFSGDGGPAAQAQLNYPAALAVDSIGNLYIADSGNHRIRRISTDGRIQTIAGTGASGNTGDGGPATAAAIGNDMFSLHGLAVDANGAVYVSTDSRIRRIAPDGIITTIAGTGVYGSTGDTGKAIDARFLVIDGLAVDAVGNLYLCESSHSRGEGARVRRIAPDGALKTVAGGDTEGFSGDGGPAVRAQLDIPLGIAVDRAGDLFVADWTNGRIRKISTAGMISTVAGNGRSYYLGDGGPATSAQLDEPFFVAVDPTGDLIVSESGAGRVRRVTASGRITTIAGTGAWKPDNVRDGQAATTANLGGVSGVAADATGNIFVSDPNNYCVWKVTPGGTIERFAGSGRTGPPNDGGPAKAANFFTPWGLALDRAGNLYIADENDHRVRKVATDGVISTVAGNGVRGFSGDGGPAIKASLDWPQSIAVDSDGNVYIADHGNHRIRKVSANGVITTVAGGGAFGSADDIGLVFGVALDSAGNLYFSGNYLYRMPPGGKFQRIAGGGPSSYSGDGGAASDAGFSGRGVAIGPDGVVYLADGYNGAVRRLDPLGELSVVNAAGGPSGAVAPGEIVTLYGAGIGPAELSVAGPGDDGRFATELAGVSVSVNGVACPLLYASAVQVGAVVPYNISNPASIRVTFRGRPAGVITVPLRPVAPAIFTANAMGTGQAAAIVADTGQRNSATTPARPGQVITVFLAGGGRTSPLPADGQVVGIDLLSKLDFPVTATVGGRSAEVLYAGGAPGQIAGLTQVNLQIPEQAGSGDIPLVITILGIATPGGVTIALR